MKSTKWFCVITFSSASGIRLEKSAETFTFFLVLFYISKAFGLPYFFLVSMFKIKIVKISMNCEDIHEDLQQNDVNVFGLLEIFKVY